MRNRFSVLLSFCRRLCSTPWAPLCRILPFEPQQRVWRIRIAAIAACIVIKAFGRDVRRDARALAPRRHVGYGMIGGTSEEEEGER